jgi:hypothetical protein
MNILALHLSDEFDDGTDTHAVKYATKVESLHVKNKKNEREH